MTIQTVTISDVRAATKKHFWQTPVKRKTKLILTALVFLVIVSALSGYLIGRADYYAARSREYRFDVTTPLKPSISRLHKFQRAAVCSDAPKCSEIGKSILDKNGSAVDAAIATMFCNGILNHQSMGLGGGHFMTVFIKDEERVYTVNAREQAPGAAKFDMFNGDWDKARKGALAVGIPGEVRGMWAAYNRWGKLPWASLIKPTIKICKDGFQLSEINYDAFMSNPSIQNDPHLRKMYYNSDRSQFFKAGTIVYPPDGLCRTFERIAEKGGDDLYNGTIALDLLDDLERVGSIITAEDLRQYEAVISDPIALPLGNGDTLYTPAPPSGGVAVANILNILSGYYFNASSINSTEDKILTYHRMIEAFKYTFSMRTKLGDMDFLNITELINTVTSQAHGTIVRTRINDTMTSNDTATYDIDSFMPPDLGTAHISIIAPNGDAVSVTSSINFYFGASFTTQKTGIVLNNVMDDFSSPGITNYFGLKPSPSNYIAPHKRPMSSMSPSIILDKYNNAKLVIGASGGTKIITAVSLVIMRKLWFDQSIKEAVDEARFHHKLSTMLVEYDYGITKDILAGLSAKGHGLKRYNNRGSVVCALYRNRTAIYANADFRKGGEVYGE